MFSAAHDELLEAIIAGKVYERCPVRGRKVGDSLVLYGLLGPFGRQQIFTIQNEAELKGILAAQPHPFADRRETACAQCL